MNEENLLRQAQAAKFLGIRTDTFAKRNYKPAKIICGMKFYDINNLEFQDKRKKQK